MSNESKSPSTKVYEKPAIRTLDASAIIEGFGPAMAGYGLEDGIPGVGG